jgi:hypothetical protein
MNSIVLDDKFVLKIQKILGDNFIFGPLNKNQNMNHYFYISPNRLPDF